MPAMLGIAGAARAARAPNLRDAPPRLLAMEGEHLVKRSMSNEWVTS